ncbi:hypothetical protein [Petrotoga sibirica]|nr:hypothetical protein [Petrotoga sibirica]
MERTTFHLVSAILLGAGIFLFFFTVVAGKKITKETVVLMIPD